MNFVRTSRLLAALAVAGAFLAACGSSPEATGTDKSAEVATVVGSSSPAKGSTPAAKPAGATERPLIRVDTSDAEKTALTQAWFSCQAKLGAKVDSRSADGSIRAIKDPVPDSIVKACAAKEPETVPQRSARLDPDYQNKMDKWVACVRSHGIKAGSDADNAGFISFDGGLPPDSAFHWIDSCQAEAFGG